MFFKQLREFSIRGHGFGDSIAKDLFDKLRWNRSLTKIDYDNNSMIARKKRQSELTVTLFRCDHCWMVLHTPVPQCKQVTDNNHKGNVIKQTIGHDSKSNIPNWTSTNS